MKFVLLHIAPPYQIYSASQRYKSNLAVPPLGLLYIGRSLEEEGHHVEIIDFNIDEHPKQVLQKLLPSTDAIGMHVNSYSLEKAKQITNEIKKEDASLPIVLGGPHCCFFAKTSLNDIPAADICVEGEAEQSIKQIALSIEGKKPLTEIPGIYFKEKGVIKKGKPPEIIENLDCISFPSRHLVKKYDYGSFNHYGFYRPRFTAMITSRGCPFHCRFCTRKVSTYQKYRERSIENVIAELQEMNAEYNSVMIVDDNFFSNEIRAAPL